VDGVVATELGDLRMLAAPGSDRLDQAVPASHLGWQAGWLLAEALPELRRRV